MDRRALWDARVGASRARKRYGLANTKSDAFDAFVLVGTQRLQYRQWRPLAVPSEQTALVAVLSRGSRAGHTRQMRPRQHDAGPQGPRLASARARGDAGNRRLHHRRERFNARNKKSIVANIAVARELAGWCWVARDP